MRLLLDGGPEMADAARQVVTFENEADTIAREVLLLTRRSFITPFDRSDIKDLINTLDDAIDQMQKTAKAITLFEVSSFEPEMAQMGDSIVLAAKLVVDAVSLLGSMREDSGVCTQSRKRSSGSKTAPTGSTTPASRFCSNAIVTATRWTTSSASRSTITSKK